MYVSVVFLFFLSSPALKLNFYQMILGSDGCSRFLLFPMLKGNV